MNRKSGESFITRIGAEVYPITLIKFLLNRKKILSYFYNVTKSEFVIKFAQTLTSADCKMCQNQTDSKQCRNHTSIKRVMEANSVLYDLDTNVYFYKNEIFKMMDNKLVIVYCPHPKMIVGTIDDVKVRKINPVTVVDPLLVELPHYKSIYNFHSLELMDESISCWFNRDFSIVTIPKDIDGHDWCLIPNN